MIREAIGKKVYHCTTKKNAKQIIKKGFNTPDVYFTSHPLLYSEISMEGGNTVLEYKIGISDKLYDNDHDEFFEKFSVIRKKIDDLIAGKITSLENETIEVVLVGHRIKLKNLRILSEEEIQERVNTL
jgi:hypothetical protein